MAGKIRGANQPGIVAEAGKHQPGLLPEPAAGQGTAEGSLRGLQEQIASGAHSPADDHHLRVQGSCQVGYPLAEPCPDIGK